MPDPSDRAPSPPPFLAMSDVDLMTALVRGEREALGELYDRHANVLLALSVRLVGIQAQAEELVHDVFIEAWHHARDFDSTRGSVRELLGRPVIQKPFELSSLAHSVDGAELCAGA